MVARSAKFRRCHSCRPLALATAAARANARSAASRSRCRATRPITSSASQATSGRPSSSAARNAARASWSASASWPRPTATCAAQASAWAVSAPGDPRAISMLAAASAHRAPPIAARAIPSCRLAARTDGVPPPSRASSVLPISMAWSTPRTSRKPQSGPHQRRCAAWRHPGRSGRGPASAGARRWPGRRGQGPPPGLQQQHAGLGPVIRALRQFGGQHAPEAGQAGVRCLHCGQDPPASSARSGGSNPASTASWVSACRDRKLSRSAAISCRPTRAAMPPRRQRRPCR